MQSSCRGLNRIRRHRHTPTLGDDEGIDTGTLRRACYCPEVTDISESVQQEHERRASRLIEHGDKGL